MSIPDELARREERLGKLAEGRAKIEAPAEHREGWIAIIRRRARSGRRECANSGHSRWCGESGKLALGSNRNGVFRRRV
jgi:hypothetical protein